MDTILLDEISEMPLALQAKLLRVLQERELERLGSDKVINLDVRVIATTNRNLLEEVAEGRFREDLYYRLNVFPLHLAPLRERRADIMPLAELFLSKYQPADRPLRLDIPAAEKIRRATLPCHVARAGKLHPARHHSVPARRSSAGSRYRDHGAALRR